MTKRVTPACDKLLVTFMQTTAPKVKAAIQSFSDLSYPAVFKADADELAYKQARIEAYLRTLQSEQALTHSDGMLITLTDAAYDIVVYKKTKLLIEELEAKLVDFKCTTNSKSTSCENEKRSAQSGQHQAESAEIYQLQTATSLCSHLPA